MGFLEDLASLKKNYLDKLNVVGTPLIPGESLGYKDGSLTGGPFNIFGASDDDLTKSEEYQLLKAAAEELRRNYAADRGNATVARVQDVDSIARLRAAEEGRTPSAAEALMRTAIDRNADRALGVAARVPQGMALRAGLDAQREGATKAASAIGDMRAAELNAARELLAQATGRARGVETSAATGTGNTLAGIIGAPYKAKVQEKAAEQARNAAFMQAGAGLIAASDKRGKKNVRPNRKMADAFLRSLPRKGSY